MPAMKPDGGSSISGGWLLEGAASGLATTTHG
jgi:hypothetical protein